MTVLQLLLVRHAQSVGNTEGRMEGTSSTGLTPLGVQQSQRLGDYLAAQGWCPTQIYCSPLERATATLAAILGRGAAGCAPTEDCTGPLDQPPPVILLDDLKEYDAGIFTGLTWADARDRYPDLCHQLETSLDWQPIPQAETLEQGSIRAQRVVAQLLNHHSNGDRILVISHHWILQQIIARLLGCDRAWGLPMANTACFEFWLDCDRWADPGPNRLNTELWRIKRFDDTTHIHG
jgi:2,3-bisphosphoglycerate-dependent phosphoglycerate mutase